MRAAPIGRPPACHGRPRSRALILALLILFSVPLLSSCGATDSAVTTQETGTSLTSTSNVTTTSAGPTTTASGSTTSTQTTLGGVSVYFAFNEKVQPVHRTAADAKVPARAALEALLQGPTKDEAQIGLSGEVPQDTRLLGLTIRDGVAIVDLSREFESGGGSLSMQMRLAQLVYTLTQFPNVSAVALRLGGTPVTALGGEGVQTTPPRSRKDFEGLTPAILVESPALGDTVHGPLRVRGTANTFEARFQLELTDWDGRIVGERQVMATSGSGTRRSFDVSVPYTVDRGGNGALIVFEQSAKDGSRIHLVEIPLQVQP